MVKAATAFPVPSVISVSLRVKTDRHTQRRRRRNENKGAPQHHSTAVGPQHPFARDSVERVCERAKNRKCSTSAAALAKKGVVLIPKSKCPAAWWVGGCQNAFGVA